VVIISDFPPTNVCLPNNGCPSDQTSDPDDVQSMVRFLLYANDFDVEGMIASAGTFANIANKTNILDMLDLYSQVYTNLTQHDLRYPTPDALRAITYQGRDGTWGQPASAILGAGMDSEASDAIINIVNEPDPRPVYFSVWTGTREIAQAIWTEQQTNTPAGFQAFLSKMRIYAIGQQDGSVGWLLTNFPNLFIICPQNTWTGMFGGPSDPLGNLTWLDTNIIQTHGPLGAVYPPAAIGVDGLKEGDTPSFLYLVSATHGLNNPEDPTQPSWGGQFIRSGSSNHFVDGPGATSVSMWKSQYQAEFAERANWMLPLMTTTVTNTAPLIGLSTTGLATQCLPGMNTSAMSLLVSNAGTGTLNYTVTNGASWLAVTPAVGSASNNVVTHTVSFNTSNLPSGAYLSSLTINAPGATPSVATVPVAVRVLNNSPGSNYIGNTPIIDVNFNEGAGISALNQGSAGGSLVVTTPVPAWSSNTPGIVGGNASVDFQTTPGSYYVESPTNYPQLIGLTQFTICGWVDCRSSTTGAGGNRVVTWINSGGDGVDLVYRNDGSLQLGINQWPDYPSSSPAYSSSGMIPTDTNASPANWRFFAVTYDAALMTNNVNFYFGGSGTPATLNVTRTYLRGATGTNISRFCIGQFDVASRSLGTDRMFRGLIDEVQVFGQALSAEEVQAAQSGSAPAAPEIHLDALNYQRLLLSWIGANMTLLEATDITGPWTPYTNQTGTQFITPAQQKQFFQLQ
jgi:hypothetical protein